jgi:mRNA interferase MazF
MPAISWLTFQLQAGLEQSGRPGALAACPVTNQGKGYRFEVAVPAGCGAASVILADYVESLGWKVRRAERFGRCANEVLDEVRAKLPPLLGY